MSDALTLRVREQNENWREIGPFHHTKLSQNISAPMKKKQITWKFFNSRFKLLFLLVVKRKTHKEDQQVGYNMKKKALYQKKMEMSFILGTLSKKKFQRASSHEQKERDGWSKSGEDAVPEVGRRVSWVAPASTSNPTGYPGDLKFLGRCGDIYSN